MDHALFERLRLAIESAREALHELENIYSTHAAGVTMAAFACTEADLAQAEADSRLAERYLEG